jgi:hypothetical protein
MDGKPQVVLGLSERDESELRFYAEVDLPDGSNRASQTNPWWPSVSASRR